MVYVGMLFLTAGLLLELLGIYLVYCGKSSSLAPIIAGLVCLLTGIIAR